MKYMIMTFGSAEEGLATMGKEWMLGMIQFMHTLDDDLRKSGELVDAQGLADGSQAKTVRIKNGIPVATDGPFAESKESLVGLLDRRRRERGARDRDRFADRRFRQGADRGPPGHGRAAGLLSAQTPRIEDLLRELAPQVLGTLVRRHGQFDACEDAVQEALLAASHAVGGGGRARQPALVADDGRLPAAGRRMAQRERPAAPGGGRSPVLELPAHEPAAERRTTPSPSCSCAATHRCRCRRSWR